jgi:DNA-binding protein H-NS
MSNLQSLLEQKAKLEEQIATVAAEQAEAKKQAITTMKSLAEQFGIVAREVFDPVRVDPKFRGPNGETWTGRGLVPKWLLDLEAAGHLRDEFKI